jgi:RNA polymerase sigma-70 factor, ECF subfamily
VTGRSASLDRECDRDAPCTGLRDVTPTDGDVIARVLAGDVDAYGIIVDRYHGRFARFATRMLGSPEDAEEALQDAFLRAYRALGAYRDRERFASWFYRILVNRCRSRLAQRRRQQAVERPLAHHDGATSDADVAAHEHTAWLVGQLAADQREVFLLRYVEDLSYEEIALITGVGVSALKMRVKRGLERLRELLHEASDG